MPQIQETISPALQCGYTLQEYTIEAILGIGGFGITYLAHDSNLHHKVAIKEFFPASLAARNPTTGTVGIKSPDCLMEFNWGKARYTQEAQTLARFNHPNIVRVNRYFEANSTSYLVMDFEDGKSLADVLRDGSEWTQARTLDLIIPLLAGLAEIHKDGYLHRDIKPDNIILRARDNSPVLIDFGSARSVASNHAMTAMVTPGYGPVEQYSTDNTDQGPWTDIYAMAAVAYHIISGRVPVPAPNRVKKDSLLPAVFAGDGRYNKALLSAIDHALSIDETKRPQDVMTWAQSLSTPTPARPLTTTALFHDKAQDSPPIPILWSPATPATAHQPILIPDPVVSVPEEKSSSADPKASAPDSPPKPARFWERLSLSPRQFWAGSMWLFSAFIVATIGALATDKGYLRTAHFIYTTAVRAGNPDLTYAFICPSYFQSEMSRLDLNGDVGVARWGIQIVISSADMATISSASATEGTTATQTWSKPKPGSFWCRDALVDFNNRKAALRADQTNRRTPAVGRKR